MNHLFNIDSHFDQSVVEAENIFNNNGIFIYPTDTIYGIGGNPFNISVNRKIILLKKRDESKNFILLAGSVKIVEKYIDADSFLLEKLYGIWPAPVSLIFKLKNKYEEIFRQQTVAFRIPENEFCMKLLNRIKSPLISTSVNPEGESPLNNYEQIVDKFRNQVDAIFFTKKQNPVISSTVVDLTSDEPKLIREGVINFMDLLKKLG